MLYGLFRGYSGLDDVSDGVYVWFGDLDLLVWGSEFGGRGLGIRVQGVIGLWN